MQKKHVLRNVIGLAMGAVITLTACGGGTGPGNEADYGPAGDDENVELTIWFGREDFAPDEGFAAFEAEHPNIKVVVDVVPLEQQPTNFIRQFDAEGAPDVIQPDFGMIPGLAVRGMLYDVAPILESWEEEDPDLFNVMTDTAWDLASYDGVGYGLGLHHGVYWNVYRKDVLDDLGLDVPATWDDVLEVGKTIKEETGMWGYVLNGSREQAPQWDMNLFAQMGGEWVDGVMQIDSEAGHYWLNFYQRAISEGVIDPNTVAFTWPDLIRNFAQGQAAMAVISRNVYTKDIEPEIAYGEEWLINPNTITRPGGEAESHYITNGWPYLVSAGTEHPYEVGLLLRYLADDPQALSVAKRYQPASNSRVMASDEYLESAPWGEDLVEPWNHLTPRPSHLNQAAMEDVIRDAMQEALANPEADVAEMAERYQTRLNELAEEVAE